MIYAPTFRESDHYTAFYPNDLSDFERLARYCSVINSIILLKMDLFVKRAINYFLLVADILICDYTWLIYKFAILKIQCCTMYLT